MAEDCGRLSISTRVLTLPDTPKSCQRNPKHVGNSVQCDLTGFKQGSVGCVIFQYLCCNSRCTRPSKYKRHHPCNSNACLSRLPRFHHRSLVLIQRVVTMNNPKLQNQNFFAFFDPLPPWEKLQFTCFYWLNRMN